jgi:hypothetical protein
MPYSTNFFTGELTVSGTVLYTVPASYTAVLRDIEIYNGSGATPLFNIQGVVPGPLNGIIFLSGSFPLSEWVQWKGRVVLPAGSEITGYASAFPFYLLLSGYLLSSP